MTTNSPRVIEPEMSAGDVGSDHGTRGGWQIVALNQKGFLIAVELLCVFRVKFIFSGTVPCTSPIVPTDGGEGERKEIVLIEPKA